MSSTTSTADPEQDKWVDDALENVKKQTFYMRTALDRANIREALKCASAMTGELRTNKLSPRNYYQLYMSVTDELRKLESFFEDEDARDQKGMGGRSVVELYEHVQHAGNIIPRLYLLITVASVYIKSKRAPAKDILFDLVELCRGVQHPMRGLFLRNYLSQMSKTKLPDAGSEYEGPGGTVKDSIEFVLQNFAEMNKLWVRMQHQGAVRDRAKRERERHNLRQLVGTNLVRLAEMQGVDVNIYQEHVLPRVLEQIVNCKDAIAQEYLMDCVVSVFPDEFHLRTLETFLGTCSQLHEQVKVKDIVISLMNRLSNFAKEHPIPATIEMFPIFHTHTSKIIQANNKMPLEDILSLQVALVNFASKVYPDRIKYIDHVLGFSVDCLKRQAQAQTGALRLDQKSERHLVDLLSIPLESLSLRILELTNYVELMSYLDREQQRRVSVNIASAIVRARSPLDTEQKVSLLLSFIAPLIRDEDKEADNKDGKDSKKAMSDADRYEFDQEQHLVARLFHQIQNADTDIHFQLYAVARKFFGQGGPLRIEYTLPPLLLASLQLAQRVHAREQKQDKSQQVKTKKVFGFVHETVSVLIHTYPELALRLFMQAAQAADLCGFEAIAYEFVAQAFICYEDEINDSKAQYNALTLILATLQQCSRFGAENYDTLVSKATQHAAKLLRKDDQCRAVYECSHLFWPGDDAHPGHRDEKRVLACLQRSLKIANTCMGSQVHLFVEILNKYLYFFDRRCPSITVKYLKGLIALVEEHLPQLDNSEKSMLAKTHYQNTLAHIKMKQSLGDETARRYLAISAADEETGAETGAVPAAAAPPAQ